jgi:hypothetical protein
MKQVSDETQVAKVKKTASDNLRIEDRGNDLQNRRLSRLISIFPPIQICELNASWTPLRSTVHHAQRSPFLYAH